MIEINHVTCYSVGAKGNSRGISKVPDGIDPKTSHHYLYLCMHLHIALLQTVGYEPARPEQQQALSRFWDFKLKRVTFVLRCFRVYGGLIPRNLNFLSRKKCLEGNYTLKLYMHVFSGVRKVSLQS